MNIYRVVWIEDGKEKIKYCKTIAKGVDKLFELNRLGQEAELQTPSKMWRTLAKN